MRGSASVGNRLLAVSAASAAIAAVIATARCDRRERAPAVESPPAPAPAVKVVSPQAKANIFFQRTCAVCHGRDGLGNGPAAGGLDVQPRNYADATWQASVTDEHIKRAILGGGASVGRDAAMPAHPQLAGQPEVLDALVVKVRSFDPSR